MSDATTAMAASAPQPHQAASSRSGFWTRLFRNPLTAAAAVWVTLLLLAWLWPGLLAPHDPYAGDVTLTRTYEGPSWDHWLGTDGQGRDLYSRVVHGARFAVNSILIAMVVAIGLGVPVGLFSGWRGGRADRIVMWVNDVLFSLPIVLLAMAVIIVLEPSLPSAMLGVGIAMATRFARLTRAVTLAEKEEMYVDAARITGLAPSTILRRYIAPNLLPSLIVQVAIISGAVILIGATLSFLGIGAKLDDPDWGVMLARARSDFRLEGIWQIVPAGGALVATVLAFNLLGDGIRDSLGRGAANSSLTVPRQVALPPVVQLHADGAVLSIRDLAVGFPASGGTVDRVLSGVSLEVYPGETLGVVGESGSGKSMTMLAALGLTPAPGYLSQGSISFDGREVTFLPEREWQEIRGRDIGVIFQEPVAALNPALRVGRQLMQSLLVHADMSKSEARARAAELLAEVQVPDPQRRLDQYPHEFSGGMAQRVGIAMALACEPKLLIADEPTTALDVTVQGQILDLMAEIQQRRRMAMILITHDLGVIADAADRVLVMYAGQVVETAGVSTLFSRPRHPYTRALLDTMPQSHRGHGDLPVIGGVVPSAAAWPDGCRFAPRCEFASDRCRTSDPLLEAVGTDLVRCVRHAEFEFGPPAETTA